MSLNTVFAANDLEIISKAEEKVFFLFIILFSRNLLILGINIGINIIISISINSIENKKN